MDAIDRMIRGLIRVGELTGRLLGNPKLLFLVIVGVVLLVHRSKSKAQEVRYHHKDPWTLLGLFTTRLVWWWRTPLAVVVVLWWLAAQNPWLAVTVAILAVMARIALNGPSWERMAAGERRHQWASKWSWRWLWACFQSDVLGRERWGAASPYPLAKAVEVRGVNAALTVKIPPRLDLAALARQEGVIGAQLGVLGLRVLPHPTGKMSLARVELLNRALGAGRRLDEIRAPLHERFLTVGFGFDGGVHWDLDNEVSIGVFGATGAGKGVLSRWLALQAVDPAHARELWIIDPQGSAEWAPFDGLPGVRLLRYDPRRPVETLDVIADALDNLSEDVAARNELCGEHGVDAWRYLPADVKAEVPRRLVLVDEVSSLLARVERNDPTHKLREEIGQRLGDGYRTARKAGIGFLHADQATYQGDKTYLGVGAVAQLGRWVALGGMRDETRDMVSGFRDWPYVAPVPGLGLTGRRADTHPDPIEVPDVDRPQVEATLAAWATTRTPEHVP